MQNYDTHIFVCSFLRSRLSSLRLLKFNLKKTVLHFIIQSRDDLVADLMRCKHSSIVFIHCLDFNYEDKLEVFALGHDYGLPTIMLIFSVLHLIQ